MKLLSFRILLIFRILLGCVFILSAVAKLVAVDHFEIYIYSCGFLPLNVSFVLARICIAGELLLGVGLVSNLHGRLVNVSTVVVLLLFCIFLCYAALIGREDNCQCFGTLLDFNPVQSLLENAVLILWTLLVSKVPSFSWRPRWYLWVIFVAGGVALPFWISPPDHWVYQDSDREIPCNKPLLEECLTTDSLFVERGSATGNRIVLFVSPRCPWCKMCVEKIQTLQRKYDLSDSAFIYVIPQLKKPATMNYSPIVVSRDLFTRITYGQRPIVVLVSDGVPEQSYHYRALDEKELRDFLASW